MQLGIQIASYLVGLPLGLMVIAAMLRGQWKKYPFVFAYVLGDFLTTVMEIGPGLQYANASAEARRSYTLLYWWDERLVQLLVFLLVISLIYRASAHLKTRNTLLLGVILGIVCFAGVTFFIYYDPSVTTGKWMTPWLRNLNFSAAVIDLVLWALLTGARRKDYTLLLVSGGLGIQFTGGAIGQALRQLSHSSVQVTAYFIALSNLICLYVFWQAFRVTATAADSSQRGPRPSRAAE